MRTSIVLMCLLVAAGAAPQAQRGAARTGMAVTVTDPRGATLPGVHVEVLGASDRSGETNDSGQIAFTGMQAGTYRLRFTGEGVITFEKELAISAGQTADVDVTLYAAPASAAPPLAPAAVVGPPGEPRVVSIIDLVEGDLIPDSEPRRESLVACSGNTRTMLVQLNQDLPERLYDSAEVTYYVIAGDGAVRIAGRETALAAGSFISLPSQTRHALSRRGRRPLIVLQTVSGVPCEVAR